MKPGQLIASTLYYGSSLVGRPTKGILDFYFSQFPDAYAMERNGDERFAVMADAIQENVGRVSSLLDVSCFEGYGLSFLAQRLDVEAVSGMDISGVALERARERLEGTPASFLQFDLRDLEKRPEDGIPLQPHDVVVVSEVLYCLGLHWRHAALQRGRKKRMIRALQACAGAAVVFQHFGRDVREPIGSVIEECGGRLVNEEWGVYVLAGNAPAGAPAVASDRNDK